MYDLDGRLVVAEKQSYGSIKPSNGMVLYNALTDQWSGCTCRGRNEMSEVGACCATCTEVYVPARMRKE